MPNYMDAMGQFKPSWETTATNGPDGQQWGQKQQLDMSAAEELAGLLGAKLVNVDYNSGPMSLSKPQYLLDFGPGDDPDASMLYDRYTRSSGTFDQNLRDELALRPPQAPIPAQKPPQGLLGTPIGGPSPGPSMGTPAMPPPSPTTAPGMGFPPPAAMTPGPTTPPLPPTTTPGPTWTLPPPPKPPTTPAVVPFPGYGVGYPGTYTPPPVYTGFMPPEDMYPGGTGLRGAVKKKNLTGLLSPQMVSGGLLA